MPLAVVLWALVQVPNYDAFSDRDGSMSTAEHGRGLIAMLRSPGQVEAIYQDAAAGNARAGRGSKVPELTTLFVK